VTLSKRTKTMFILGPFQLSVCLIVIAAKVGNAAINDQSMA
jgi:hypothetical protein